MASVKTTLSLREELLEAVDRYVREHPGESRSSVCASALTDWLREQQEAEIACYYEEMTPEEKTEEEGWRRVSAASASKMWP